jgi:hypothetical protein
MILGNEVIQTASGCESGLGAGTVASPVPASVFLAGFVVVVFGAARGSAEHPSPTVSHRRLVGQQATSASHVWPLGATLRA